MPERTPSFITRKRVQVAAAIIGAPAALGLVSCGGGSDSGKTFVSGDLTQTAQALNATPTQEGTKVIVVEPTATPIPTRTPEPIPTSTPEKVYTPEEVSALAIQAVATMGDTLNASKKQQITGSVKFVEKYYYADTGTGKVPEGSPEKIAINTVLGSYADAARDLLDAACTNPADANSAKAFLAIKGTANKYMNDKIAAGQLPQPVYVTIYRVPPDCKNPVLVPPSK